MGSARRRTLRHGMRNRVRPHQDVLQSIRPSKAMFSGKRQKRCCLCAEGISTAAEEALQQGGDSQPSDSPSSSPMAQGADAPSASGGTWKAQQGVIGDLLHLWVAWSPRPCQTILGLLQGALAQVPSHPLTGKKAQEAVGPYPGVPLCHPYNHSHIHLSIGTYIEHWSIRL